MGKNKNYGQFFKKDEERKEIQVPKTMQEITREAPKAEEPEENVQTPAPKPEIVAPKENRAKVIGNKKVNFRTGPSTNARILFAVNPGSVVTIVDKFSSTWWKVNFVLDHKPYDGYMMAQFLKEV